MILRKRLSLLYCVLAVPQVIVTVGMAQQPTPPRTQAVVYPFTVAGAPAPSDGFAARACPKDVAALPTEDMEDAEKVISAISQEMIVALSQHNIAAQPATPTQILTPATLVFTGCLTGMKRGSAAARSISMGAGGSQIVTHVRTFTAGPDGAEINAREYDLVTKGTNYGGGLIVGLARAKRTSVEGDGRHAADQIVDRYLSDVSMAVKASSDSLLR